MDPRAASSPHRAVVRGALRAAVCAAVAGAILCASVTASCAATDPSASPGGGALTASVFPLASGTRTYVLGNGVNVLVRLEAPPSAAPSANLSVGAATLWVGDGPSARRLDISTTRTGIAFSNEPGASTELIRVGVMPGAEWASGATLLRFEGWDRIEVPAGVFDAARVRSTLHEGEIRQEETWWFAEGAGIVRLRSNYGGLFVGEMSLLTR